MKCECGDVKAAGQVQSPTVQSPKSKASYNRHFVADTRTYVIRFAGHAGLAALFIVAALLGVSERRDVRLCRRPAPHFRPRRLRAERHHSRIRGRRRDARGIRDRTAARHFLRRDRSALAQRHHLGRRQGLQHPLRSERSGHARARHAATYSDGVLWRAAAR